MLLRLTFIAPEHNVDCFLWSDALLPDCKIPSRLSSSSIVLDTTLDEGSRWFNLFDELVEELEGGPVEELLICIRDVGTPIENADFSSLLNVVDSESFVPKSKWPVTTGCVDAFGVPEEQDIIGKYGVGVCSPAAATACAAAAAAAWVCSKAADACREFWGDKNGDVLALRIKCACSCCRCAEWTNAGLIAPIICIN